MFLLVLASLQNGAPLGRWTLPPCLKRATMQTFTALTMIGVSPSLPPCYPPSLSHYCSFCNAAWSLPLSYPSFLSLLIFLQRCVVPPSLLPTLSLSLLIFLQHCDMLAVTPPLALFSTGDMGGVVDDGSSLGTFLTLAPHHFAAQASPPTTRAESR